MNGKDETGGGVPPPATDRRTFLRKAGALIGAGMGAYAAGLPGALGAVQSGRRGPTVNVVPLRQMRSTALETMDLSAFAQQLNTRFTFQTGDGAVDMVLVDAKDLLTSAPGHEVIQDCFSVVFRGPLQRPLEQGTYPARHRSLGSFDLFIVPVRQDGGHLYYEAVFNRLRTDVDPSRL